MRGESDGVTERKEQDMEKDQNKDKPRVQIDMFNWGPCVVRLRINEEFQKKLLDEAKQQ